MALIGITTVVLSLAVVVNIGASSLREKDLEYQAREQNLEKLEAEEIARTAQLEEYRAGQRGHAARNAQKAAKRAGGHAGLGQGKAGPGQKRRDFV